MSFPSAAPMRRAVPPPPITSLEARAGSLPLDRLVARRPLMRLVPDAAPSLAFVHFQPDDAALAAELGMPLAGDVARHLADCVALRLPDALAGPLAALPGAAGEHLIDLPVRALEAPAPPGRIAALPLSSAADPVAFATLAEQGRRRGWGVALRGLTATTLAWLRPQVIAADWFLLHWSEALPDAAAALRRLDPGRIILTGCDTGAALDWGLGLGIRVFGGRQLEGVPGDPGGRA